MLSPLSTVLDSSSAADGSDAITFMSGSGTAPGDTMTGSSPGCQRSMLSAAPIDELPKNRLAVFTEKPSCGAAETSAPDAASDAAFESSGGCISSDFEASYCASGGALSASASSGSSGTLAARRVAVPAFAPSNKALAVQGASFEGAAPPGAAGSGLTMT